ncbi:MAG: hypothetical protein A2583_11090 [Bdellovibrionales bacterium RIFOXYD1_FULL_53_11]|nr:MAG: hypothetical protein A2583_11090 [Bdellovibrionales bacterium RIFOXYD1_FULL_53_11]
MKNLSIESLYQIAQKMEQDAVVFYQKLIDESPEDSHKRLFRLIQSEEKKHLYTFNEIINKVWGNKLKRDLPVESEITSFLFEVDPKIIKVANELSNIYFSNAKLRSSGVHTILQSIEFSIENELLAIEFYQHLKNMLHPRLRLPMDRIIQQENGHHDKLITAKNKLKHL